VVGNTARVAATGAGAVTTKKSLHPDHRKKRMSQRRKSLASAVFVWTEANLMHWYLVGIFVLAWNVLHTWSKKSCLVQCAAAALSVQCKSMFEVKFAAYLVATCVVMNGGWVWNSISVAIDCMQ